MFIYSTAIYSLSLRVEIVTPLNNLTNIFNITKKAVNNILIQMEYKNLYTKAIEKKKKSGNLAILVMN